MRYDIEVTREGSNWLAKVTNLQGAHTFARNLPALFSAVDEVIRLVLNIDNDVELQLDYRYIGLEPAAYEAIEIAGERLRNEQEHTRLLLEMNERVLQLIQNGYSVRDTASLVGVSPGRVSQITVQHRGPKKQERMNGLERLIEFQDTIDIPPEPRDLKAAYHQHLEEKYG